MGRHAVFEGIEILLHAFLGHASCCDLIQQHLIVMDTLTACGDLQAVEEQVKAQRKLRICRVIHRIEGTLFRRIMGNKYEVRAVFFLEIPADQNLLLRLQVVGVADLMAIFFGGQTLRLVEANSRNLICLRQGNAENLQLLGIVGGKKIQHILQEAGLHSHDILEAVDIAHLEVQTGIFIQVALRIVLLCTENRAGLENAIENAYHHLLIELRALSQYRRMVEVIQAEKV